MSGQRNYGVFNEPDMATRTSLNSGARTGLFGFAVMGEMQVVQEGG